MKFSRSYERDADLNGARMMSRRQLRPAWRGQVLRETPGEVRRAERASRLALWLSSHPASGSRVQYVTQDIQFYPKRDYTASTGRFTRVRQVVGGLPPPKPKPAAMLQPQQGKQRTGLPEGYNDFQARGFAIAYPGNWQAGQAQSGGSVYLVPQGGVKQARTEAWNFWLAP